MKDRASKLDAHAESLRTWFGIDHLSLQDAAARLAERGVKVSLARLSTWWATEQQKTMRAGILAGIASGSALCTDMDRALGKVPEPGMEQITKLLKIVVMKLAGQGQLDPELLKLVNQLLRPIMEHATLQQKERSLGHDERKLQLLEARAAKADAAQKVNDTQDLTPEQKVAKMKEIFAIG